MFCCTSEVTLLSAWCATRLRSFIRRPKKNIVASSGGKTASVINVNAAFTRHITATINRTVANEPSNLNSPC